MNIYKHYPFKIEPLPYDYNELEPYIDAETLHYHHDKHLQTYIDNLNKTLELYPEYHDWTLMKLLLNIPFLPSYLQAPIKNNGGGVFNHELYFNSMRAPQENNEPTGELKAEIDKSFGSYEDMKKLLKGAALSQFGSGYGWLVYDYNNGLEIENTPNQNTPLQKTKFPLLPVDVWEHAYYLKYRNSRADYVENWFKLINWDFVNNLFNELNKPM